MTNRIEANLHSGHIVDMMIDNTVTAIGDLVTVDG